MKLKVGHRDIVVKAMSGIDAADLGARGLFSTVHSCIRIDRTLPPQEQAAVLLHEIIHACFNAFGLADVLRDEESTCGVLDRPLATVIRDNPRLLLVLQAALSGGKPIVR